MTAGERLIDAAAKIAKERGYDPYDGVLMAVIRTMGVDDIRRAAAMDDPEK